jgi:hypothetical protein
MPDLNYQDHYNLALSKNIERLQKEIDSPATKIKIKNWANKFNKDPIEIRQKIIDDELFSLHYIIEPSRQNFHENLAADYISRLENVDNFKNLPNGGANSLIVHSGTILKKSETQSNAGKTIDFSWNTGIFKCYASHKFTKDNGGSQDNQYKDIRGFMENSRPNNVINTLFFAICDGNYYQNTGQDGLTKIQILNRDLEKNNKLIALTINQLSDYLGSLQQT